MIAVIFEVTPKDGQKENYLDVAASLKPHLAEIDGFISVERFQSLTNPRNENEAALEQWRNLAAHRGGQKTGREKIFEDYRLRVAHVSRDYGMFDRDEAPKDSLEVHD